MGNNTPIPGTLETVPHMPDYVCIYRIPSSKFWWCRVWLPASRHYMKRSAKTTDRKEAQDAARQLYIESVSTNRTYLVRSNPKSFAAVAESLLREEKANAKKSLWQKDSNMLNNQILPELGTKLLTEVTHVELTEYLGKLNAKGLSPATKKHHMGLIGKVFNHGIRMNVIQTKPPFPKMAEKMRTKEKRDYLTLEEYKHLGNTIIRMEKEKFTYRGTPVTLEHKLIANFMINSFLRPTDLKVLKHKHIKRAKDGKVEWLILSHPATKTTADDVHTMPDAVKYYEELLKFRDGKSVGPDDYVFFPEYQNRDHGMNKLGKIFAEIFKASKLEETTGKNLSLYSFRHTSLMYRILYSDVDVLTLAKNARSSVQMLETFYLSHLTTDQARKRLHSFSKKEK